jgi:hypothetical protein
MPSRYPEIPGVNFSTVDGNLVIVRDRPLTDSVLIIGPALDGPTDVIIPATALAGNVEKVYGPISYSPNFVGPNGETSGPTNNDLIRALREVQSGGAADIRMIRVGGNPATGVFTMPAQVNAGATGTIIFTSRWGGKIYNGVRVDLSSGATSGVCTITQPTWKGGAITIAWSQATSGKTIAQLVDDINSNGLNLCVKASVGTIVGSAPARVLNGGAALAGATDGTRSDDLLINKTPMYQNLIRQDTGTFDLIADSEQDIVYLAGVYLDDQVTQGSTSISVATDFANYLGRRSVDHPQIGVIGVRPINDFTTRDSIIAHYQALINPSYGNRTGDNWLYAGPFMKAGFSFNDGTLEQTIDSGAYLQVVAADAFFNDRDLGFYWDSLAGVYAGTLASLKPQQPASQKPVNGILSLPYVFTRAQLNTMVGGIGRDVTMGVQGGGGYVCVQRIEGQGILFVRDATASQRSSDFKDLQVLRIVNAVHKGVKSIARRFLGLTQDIPTLQALEQQVKGFLDGMAEANALLGKDGIGYMMDPIATGRDPLSRLLGRIDVNITIRPAFQIKEIRCRVSVSN